MFGYPRGARRTRQRLMLARLTQALVVFAVLGGSAGPLTPQTRAGDLQGADDSQPKKRIDRSEGRLVDAAPAPITTPIDDGGPSVDPTVEGEPLFLPYTAPDEVTELPDERTRQTRTLANPDGSFTLEASNGPLNYMDSAGAWQPIDLSLVPQEGDGYKVAATEAAISLATKDGKLGTIELGGHRVSLTAPGYNSAGLGTDADAKPREVQQHDHRVRDLDPSHRYRA